MTLESVKAIIDQALLRNSTHGDGSQSSHEDNPRHVETTRPCFYADFIKCHPLNFKIRTLGPEAYAMTWEVLKKKMTDKYCPQGELNKLEIELWNLKRDGKETPRGNGCFKCGASGHFKRDCPKLKNKNGGNRNVQGWVYAVGNAEKNENAPMNPDSNVVTGTFLLNNHYASILFDTGADRSFISIVFSSLVNIDPTPLGSSYDVELADGKIVRIDTIIQGCTINFLNHPRNIYLMPVELGSFDVIIGMDWLRRCRTVIVCDEKLVRIPYGNETLTFCDNESNNGRESRLTVVSRSKAQRYMAKGCQTFMAQISAKKEEDKSEGKQLKDVPIVQDFPEVFSKDLPGLPPARPVEFQIDLILGVAPVQFLCHVIDSRGIHVDPAKIESIKDWASPKTPMEIRQFLGLAGYYQRFIEGFSKIAKSMKNLTQKGINFDWGEKEENAFQLIKQKLCSRTVRGLYGRKCRSPVCWDEVGEAQLTGLEMIQETTKKIILIKQRIQAAQDRQKSFADRKRKPMEFNVRDRVMLKVSPWKGVIRFIKRGKLNPRVHHTFHVSYLKKYYADEPLGMPLEGVHIDETL
nr:putative reverse transcriptase domain-containing protein [Tanacetum cinerariifolium]